VSYLPDGNFAKIMNAPISEKQWSLGPKNGLRLERRVWQFYTICDKNQLLKLKIDKVTAILVPRAGGASAATADIGLCAKVCMGLYGETSENQL
jgi:hypothetical protein